MLRSSCLSWEHVALVQGSLPWWLATLIIGRDVALMGGAFVHRFHQVGRRWPGAADFFRISSSSPNATTPQTHATASPHVSARGSHAGPGLLGNNSHSSSASENKRSGWHKVDDQTQSVNDSVDVIAGIGSDAQQPQQQQLHKSGQRESAPQPGQQHSDASAHSTQPAAFMQPLYISKVNTCFQLLLVGGCLSSSWYAWPSQEVLFGLGVLTGCTTVGSSAAYASAYLRGKIK